MKKSIIVLLVVLAIISVAAIGIAASKRGNDQGQNNNDQGCKPGSTISCSYTGPAGTEGVGDCKAGAKTCNKDGEWGRCVGQVIPTAEACGDDLDNDCDGQIDEGCDCTLPCDTDEDCFNGEGTCMPDRCCS